MYFRAFYNVKYREQLYNMSVKIILFNKKTTGGIVLLNETAQIPNAPY